MQSCKKHCKLPSRAMRRFGRQTFSTHHCIVLHTTAIEVNSAFYASWEGKMSISFRAE